METRLRILWLSICFFNLPYLLHAQTVIKKAKSLYIYIDQDFFYPVKNEDRNYTMGVVIGYSADYLKYINPFSSVPLKKFNDNSYYFQFGYGAFTPMDLSSTLPVYDDRPYAGIFNFQVSRIAFNPNTKTALFSDLSLGFLGSNVGKGIQTGIHKFARKYGWSDREDPLGWHNQISDGGELTGKLTLGRKKLLFEDGGHLLKVTNQIEASAGYYTNLTFGLTAYLGDIDNWYTFNPNGTSSINQLTGEQNDISFFIYTSVRERYVFYNVLLQGQFKENPHELNKTEIRNMVFEYDLGFKFIFHKKGVGISYKITGRSPEYNIDDKKGRWHYWGAIYLDKTF